MSPIVGNADTWLYSVDKNIKPRKKTPDGNMVDLKLVH
uniref:IncF plasmid conjugative transfer pilus assembly protein TraC n=1 Tax=Klebsiella pneumoniae TaxID=573 RepID=A0A8B0SSL0_KLEPN|nr:IncF plasmid conjugative transfer pilus assembly protein TraC [Klebsiella pneumoniae]